MNLENVTANDKEYKWNMGSGADVGDEYYIKISYSDDPSIFAYSDKFKLGAIESSSTKDLSSSAASPTGSPTSSAPATTSNAASLPTQFATAPVMVGAAAVGIFAF